MTDNIMIMKGKTALVVEDEQPLLNAIKIKLGKNGFSVITSRTVNQALGYLKDIESIDVIWLDHYLLGKEDGLDFVAKLKSGNEKWKKIPIFVVSNTAGPEKMQSYIRLGINKYYVKAEHRLDEIVNDIKIFLDNSEGKLSE